jgi:hypothetical protein
MTRPVDDDPLGTGSHAFTKTGGDPPPASTMVGSTEA